MNVDHDFQGLCMVVTGGASGIGHAIASAALARGAAVAVLDLDPSTAPPGATGWRGDVADDDSVTTAIAAAAASMGALDIVINNAGIGAQGTVEQNSMDEWRHVFDVNVFGMVRVMRAALPHLRNSSHAAVVNTCSIAATAGLPERALYSATKGAVLSLTLAMAADHLHEGIRVNCVNPGPPTPPGSDGCSTVRPIRSPNVSLSNHANPPADSSPPAKSRPQSSTLPAHRPAQPPEPPSPSTAAWQAFASARAIVDVTPTTGRTLGG